MRKDGIETRKKILSVCVRLFLEQGYKHTSVTQIVEEAGIARGSYQNQFPTKDAILMELVKTMFGRQFSMAWSVTGEHLSPIYTYAVETAIQLTLTELNENLREIYIEAYSLPNTAEYIHLKTAEKLKEIFSPYLPDHSDNDFYELEIGTAGLIRNYMSKKCDIRFPLSRKLERFLTCSMRIFKVPEAEIQDAVAFVSRQDMKAIAGEVIHKLFTMLEMKYNFKLSSDVEVSSDAE